MSASDTLHKILEMLPVVPGVYLMKDARGRIVYIGKAVNLRNRVRSYFVKHKTVSHFAAYLLKDRVADIEWIITHNEAEALILEANLVRKHSPRYNIELKDDKHFPYLRFTLSEPFPRLRVTRRAAAGRETAFGPYTDSAALRKTMEFIYKVFRIRDCKLKFPLKKKIEPCLTYHIGRCDAPCAGLCSEAEYGRLVDEAVRFLKGRRQDLVTGLKKEMAECAAAQAFEKAARIRDQIKAVEQTLEQQKVDLGRTRAEADLIAVAREGRAGCALVLRVREGVVIDRKSYELSSPLDQDESAMITQFMKRFYAERENIPRRILLSHPLEEEENLARVLTVLRKGPVGVEVPQRGIRKRQVALAFSNARMNLAEYVAARERRNRLNFAVQALQEDLHLSTPPRRIEAFDISHLGGTDTVASLVVFVDGRPKKSQYRRYTVRSVDGIDDFAAMREVVDRRVRRLVEEKSVFPDLFLIDGGKGQLSAALKSLEKWGKGSQEIVGLAKRLEEVYRPGLSVPVMIPRVSPGLKLIQQVRNESHRFAIAFQKSKRRKYVRKIWLDEIPGVGPKTIQKLLKRFGSPEKIRAAPEKTLAECVGKAVAGKVTGWLQRS